MKKKLAEFWKSFANFIGKITYNPLLCHTEEVSLARLTMVQIAHNFFFVLAIFTT